MSPWIYIFCGVSGVSIVGILAFLIKLFINYGRFSEQFENLQKTETECPINEIKTDVKVLSAQFKFYLQSVGLNMADALREHKKIEMDTLLDKMNRGASTFDELIQLATLLRNDMLETRNDETDVKAHRIGMASLLAVVNVQICGLAEVKP